MEPRQRLLSPPTRHAIRAVIVGCAAIVAVVFAVLALRPAVAGDPVVVAKTDIAAGEAIARSDVRIVVVTPDAIPDNALVDVEAALGIAPTRAIPGGTVLTASMVTEVGDGSLPPGHSQTVVLLDAASVFMKAGDIVDVWGTAECSDDACTAHQIASDVEVVKVELPDAGAFCAAEQARVTLMLRTDDVGTVLSTAQTQGLHFVLRDNA